MQSNKLGRFHRLVKIAVDGFFNIGPQLLQRVAFRVDPETQRRCIISAIHLIFSDVEDDLAHITKILRSVPERKAIQVPKRTILNASFACPANPELLACSAHERR
jgi:hypothetical protein